MGRLCCCLCSEDGDRKAASFDGRSFIQTGDLIVALIIGSNDSDFGTSGLGNLLGHTSSELVQQDLYFGRNIAGGGEVSEADFQAFIDAEITPRFPDGLTVYDANGQFLDSTGTLIQEPSQVVTLLFENTLENEAKVDQIIEAYRQQFQQESVLEVVNADHLKVGFDEADDLIENDPIPEFIQQDLYFGRNIAGGGEVSEAEFQAFIDAEITPRFPDGLTVYDADGQFLNGAGDLIKEPSQVVSLIFEDTVENEHSIDQIITAYKQQFQQESVLEVVNEAVKVGFGQSEDLIDNDPIPELIQTDLYFGRNIAEGGEVSEAEFQQFLDQEITPRFPDGLTVYDADGQFLSSTNTLVQEPSKVVSLIFEDTVENEAAIDQIIQAYKQQFQQESVLQVVDEDIQVAFDTDTIFLDDLNNQFDGFKDSDDIIDGRGGSDLIRGLSGDDLLRGGAGNDWLNGNSGNDILFGEGGNDTLIGGKGTDTLTGGEGHDSFRFNQLHHGGDRITDFAPEDDQILIRAAGFGSGLVAGTPISPEQFSFGMAAADGKDRWIYNNLSGELFFDRDGNGCQAQVLVAVLSGAPNLNYTNIVVV
jgi:transcription termination factor NusB